MISIRRAEHRDAASIIAAHVRSIREVCSKSYTPAQIEAWSSRDFKENVWCQTIDRDCVWVLDSGERILGFGHLRFNSAELGTIEGLYFVPEANGRGLGKKLMSLIYAHLEQTSVEKLVLQATLNAEGFYYAMGFQSVGSTFVEFHGEKVECVDMVNSLPF
ncbi:MAG: GNAT family N-acetyltransferase [Pseudomonadales bacterium]|nr:GNAT family N-acetyltransferase [Pseudomonadales bacterium]